MLSHARTSTLPAGGEPFLSELRRPDLTIGAMVLTAGVAVGVALTLGPLMGVLLVVAVAATLSMSQRPQLCVGLMVMVAPTCAGLDRGLLVPGLRISEAVIAGLGLLVLVFAARVERPPWTRVETLLLLYAVFTVVLGGIDLISRHASLTTEDLGTLLGPLQFVILVRSVVVALNTERRIYRAAVWMLGAVTIIGVIALAQFADLGPTRDILQSISGGGLYEKSLQEGIGRVTGPFSIWHELAGVLMPCILLSLTFMLNTRSLKGRVGFGFVLAVTSTALLSTATMGITVVTILGAFYILWKRGVLHIAATVAVPLVILALLLFGDSINGRAEQQYTERAVSYKIPLVPESIAYRYMIFREQNAPALAGRWATGFGPDLPPELALGNFPHAETTYVLLLMRGGVPLLAIFLLLTIAILLAARAAQRTARTDFQLSLATVVLITSWAYLILQLIESYLVDSGPPQAYLALVGMMLAVTGHRLNSPGAEDSRLNPDSPIRSPVKEPWASS